MVTASAVTTSCHDMSGDTVNLDAGTYQVAVSRDSTKYTTGDEAMAIHLASAILSPDVAKDRLRGCLEGGLIRECQSWPIASDRLMWALAAWEIYLADGDIDWLLESYEVISATLKSEIEVRYDRRMGLLKGEWYQAQTNPALPKWMTSADRAEYMSLTGNVVTAQACLILSMMEQEAYRLRKIILQPLPNSQTVTAESLRRSVNNMMWAPAQGTYCAGLYAPPYPLQSPGHEPIGEALAAITAVANTEMARSAVANTPLSVINDTASSGTFASAYWAWSANVTRNSEAIRALAYSHDLTINDSTPIPQAATNAALVLRGLAGARLTTDAITFSPLVPRELSGEKKIGAIPYRHCLIYLTINGTGATIDHWSLNGKRQPGQPRIGADASGRIDLVIDMANDHTDRSTINDETLLLPPPCIVDWQTPLRGTVADPSGGASYYVMSNGVLTSSTTTPDIELRKPHRFSQTQVFATAGSLWGWACEPHVIIPDGTSFVYPPRIAHPHAYAFITDSITTGTYMLQAESTALPATPAAVGAVLVNGTEQGTIVLAPGLSGDTCASSHPSVKLNGGYNRLEIIGYNNPRASAHTLRHYQITAIRLTLIDN